jgi:hypothetical protein
MTQPNHLRRNLGDGPIEPVRKIPTKVTAVFHRRRVFDRLGKDVLFKHGAERRGSLTLCPAANLRVFATYAISARRNLALILASATGRRLAEPIVNRRVRPLTLHSTTKLLLPAFVI